MTPDSVSCPIKGLCSGRQLELATRDDDKTQTMIEPDLLLHLKHEISTVSERPSVGERVLRLESLPEECDRGSHLLHRDSCIAELREVSGFDELTPGDVWAVGRVLTDDRCVLFAAAGVAVDPPL